MRPSLLGSSAKSIAWRSAVPLHEVEGAEQTLRAYNLAAGGYTQFAGDDVRDMGAVAAVGRGVRRTDRIRIRFQYWIVIRIKRGVRPALANEVVTTNDLGAREESVIRGGAGVIDHEIARSCRNCGNERWCCRERRPCRLISGLRTRTTKGFVCVVDAAVDDGDTNALAARAEIMRRLGADVRHGLGKVQAVVGHADHARDRGVTSELRQIGGVDAQHHRIGGQLHGSHDFRIRRRRENAIDHDCLLSQHLFAAAGFARACNRLADETHEYIDATFRALEARMQNAASS
jgi:hypothetical protein